MGTIAAEGFASSTAPRVPGPADARSTYTPSTTGTPSSAKRPVTSVVVVSGPAAGATSESTVHATAGRVGVAPAGSGRPCASSTEPVTFADASPAAASASPPPSRVLGPGPTAGGMYPHETV